MFLHLIPNPGVRHRTFRASHGLAEGVHIQNPPLQLVVKPITTLI
jgi:hypothetical protein